jgi:putative oxidoreductase
MRARIFDAGPHGFAASLGLLALRLGAGLLLPYLHGMDKLAGFAKEAATFPDPLGIGSKLSMAGTIGGELVFPILVAVGLATRLCAIPPAFTMGVAAFLVLDGDPMKKKELALLYLIAFVALACVGAGRFSLDAMLGGSKRPKRGK